MAGILSRRIKDTILENEVDVIILEPLVTLHSVSENDNVRMNAVIHVFAAPNRRGRIDHLGGYGRRARRIVNAMSARPSRKEKAACFTAKEQADLPLCLSWTPIRMSRQPIHPGQIRVKRRHRIRASMGRMAWREEPTAADRVAEHGSCLRRPPEGRDRHRRPTRQRLREARQRLPPCAFAEPTASGQGWRAGAAFKNIPT